MFFRQNAVACGILFQKILSSTSCMIIHLLIFRYFAATKMAHKEDLFQEIVALRSRFCFFKENILIIPKFYNILA
jgi:hypothetical protein